MIVPAGWLHCNGRLLHIDLYSDLYSAIGTTYTTLVSPGNFQIPDLRGRIGVGSYEGSSDASYNLTQRTRGDISGAETHTLNINEMPAHTHTYLGIQSQSAASGLDNVAENSPRPTETTSSTGGNQAHNNMQPYVVVRYLIKY